MRDARTMDVDHATAIARKAHRTARPLQDALLLSHVERVAASVPEWARPIAWLHEVLERSDMSEEELLREGLSSEELRAMRLLSRQESTSDAAYLGHIELIVRAGGTAGRLARAIKRADLEDRRGHPLVRRNGWSPPYARALHALERPESARSRGAA
jgi:hypothetical protein